MAKKTKITVEIICDSSIEYEVEEAYKKILCNADSYVFKKERVVEED